uniref:Uncharacterized protein n=1 Tax=Rhizophora mucronata TaxID=61149 RepID=A0A2P2K7E1_RHIMU
MILSPGIHLFLHCKFIVFSSELGVASVQKQKTLKKKKKRYKKDISQDDCQ